jgi:hypothetical protein
MADLPSRRICGVKSVHRYDVGRAFLAARSGGAARPVDIPINTLTVPGMASLGCNTGQGPNLPVVRWLAEEPSACAPSSVIRLSPYSAYFSA